MIGQLIEGYKVRFSAERLYQRYRSTDCAIVGVEDLCDRRLPIMTSQQLEARLSSLEQELEQVKHLLQQNLPKTTTPNTITWWEAIAGTFPDDDAFHDAEQIGREWRNTQQVN
jgi:hypothetical protein